MKRQDKKKGKEKKFLQKCPRVKQLDIYLLLRFQMPKPLIFLLTSSISISYCNNFIGQTLFHLTWNRVIAAVGTNWKIRQRILVLAISCSTFQMPKAVIITITVSFLYSTLASILRWTAFPSLCYGGPRPIASNWIFYKDSWFEIKI